ncbi:MAG: hypothetical protein D6736_02945 [Nitrospinota bacterium]|nr:MAG: hypothetical protein D6736_02945 [Nitrospinota bacterium]
MIFSWRSRGSLFPERAAFLPSSPPYFSQEFYADLAIEYSMHYGWTAEERQTIVQCILRGIRENLSSRRIAREIARALDEEENETWQTIAQTGATNVQLWQYLETLVRQHKINRRRKSILRIPDIQVFRTPAITGCPRCKALWLNAEGAPKLFSLEELIVNGSNYGREELLPVIGVVHERCLCSQIQHYQPEMQEIFEMFRTQDIPDFLNEE